mgnify:CR=1 FL=1
MDIQKFQEKLAEICELGEKSGKILKPQQIKECFGEMDLDKSQLIKILQYLKLKGDRKREQRLLFIHQGRNRRQSRKSRNRKSR